MMKLLVVFATLVVACLTVDHKLLQWKSFKLENTKKYDAAEDERRLVIFEANLVKIEEHNKRYEDGLETYTMGITQFADMTTEEFLAFVNHYSINNYAKMISENTTVFQIPDDLEVAASADWRSKGAVTGVKNQGSCGSCWSFSATGAMEGQSAIKKGQLISLSEQNLMDCSSSYGNYGCNGGLMDNAFAYVRDHGIERESDYPYEGRVGSCRFSPSKSVLSVKNYVSVTTRNEAALTAALSSVGPVSVAIDATAQLQHYTSGYFYDTSCSSSSLNHGVLAVGYGGTGSQEYYLVKNSWGTSWGEQGYVKMARNRGNRCGIATLASYPNLK